MGWEALLGGPEVASARGHLWMSACLSLRFTSVKWARRPLGLVHSTHWRHLERQSWQRPHMRPLRWGCSLTKAGDICVPNLTGSIVEERLLYVSAASPPCDLSGDCFFLSFFPRYNSLPVFKKLKSTEFEVGRPSHLQRFPWFDL